MVAVDIRQVEQLSNTVAEKILAAIDRNTKALQALAVIVAAHGNQTLPPLLDPKSTEEYVAELFNRVVGPGRSRA